MSTIVDSIDDSISQRVRREREARGWSLAELAARSGVSRAMISKVERGDASPTASVLGRLSGAFGLTLSALLARAEAQGKRVLRAAEQPIWRDPESGYVRRSLIAMPDVPLELTQVELPPGADIGFPCASYTFFIQAIWVIDGRLRFVEGDVEHELGTGDSIVLGTPNDCAFRNESRRPCRYLVAIVRR
ncbi:MAG: helix-turn-helix domain-containing protein [Gammaproteobacteria bacterium]